MNLELKIPPPIVALCSAVLMWGIAKMLPAQSFDFNARKLCALLILIIGLTIDILALMKFRRTKTTVNPMQPQQTSELVTIGIYRLSRNPMYLGLLLVLTSWGIYLSNFLVLAVLPLFIFYITKFQIIPEERVMWEKFGESFQDYKQSVRRWI